MALEKINNKKKHTFLKILFFLIILIAIIHIGLFVFLNAKGKDILKETIKKNLGADAQVDVLTFRFPFTVVITNFKCGDISFKKANISLGLINPFNQHISFNNIYLDSLYLKVTKTKDGLFLAPILKKTPVSDNALENQQTTIAESPKTAAKGKKLFLKVGKLYIKNAIIELTDSAQDSPTTYTFKNINFELKHLVYPQLAKFYIKFNASLEKSGIKMDDLITMQGWIDYFHKNMDVAININNFDYSAFDEYYSSFWKPQNLGIKEAKLSLENRFNSVNNDLTIEGILSLDKIEFIEPIEDNSNAKTIKTILAIYKGDSEKATLPIRLKTKMDAVKLDFSSIKTNFNDRVKLGPVIFIMNAFDKTKGKFTEKAKEIKEKAKEAKDITTEKTDKAVEKTIDTIQSILGTVKGVIKKSKEASKTVEGGEQNIIQPEARQLEQGSAPQINTPAQENLQQNPAAENQPNVSVPASTNTPVQNTAQPEPGAKAEDNAVGSVSNAESQSNSAVQNSNQPQ